MFAIERARWTVLLAALLLGLGCSSTTPTPTAEPEPPKEAATDPTPTGGGLAETAPALDPVYFDTDEARLRMEARRSLDQLAQSILDHPEWGVIRIDGHCDERGSDAYNEALGRRRAAAVERYLIDQGVPRDRITTRSFGSERPAVHGSSESAWSKNRRSEFQLGTLTASSS